jgi:release factor glutamine methyltransferase
VSPTIREVIQESESRLSGVDSPRLSAELLLAHALGCPRLTLTLDRDRALSDHELASVEALIRRREGGEPVAYILGTREFYGLDFLVTPAVLIPRPETEHIVEEVEKAFDKRAEFRFADLGTGSGILAVTIATLFPGASGVAVDISAEALAVAEENAKAHGVAERIDFQRLDFTRETVEGEFDLIVSNPPYVTQREFEEASREVTAFEPTGALVSGEDGLDHVRAMLPGIVTSLKHGGRLLMEIGFGQGDAIVRIITNNYPIFDEVTVLKDLAGLDRVVSTKRL